MSDIFNILPDIVIYIVLGYICLHMYRITRIVKKSYDFEHILTESIVVGFIIKNVISLIPFTFGEYIDTIGMIISSAAIGFGVAKILETPIADKVINILKIKHTKFKYMWQNIDDPNYAIFIDATNPKLTLDILGRL